MSRAPTPSRAPSLPSSSPGGRCDGRPRRPGALSTARSTRRAPARSSARSSAGCVRFWREPPRERSEPVPAPARRQPGRVASVGRGGVRAGPCRRPPAARLGRLQRLPLVSRDGARVVRGPGHRGGDERALRQREGRSRGAPRRRRGDDGRHGRDDRKRRLADHGLHDAGRTSRSTRARTSRPSRDTACRLPAGAGGGVRRLARAPRRPRRQAERLVEASASRRGSGRPRIR